MFAPLFQPPFFPGHFPTQQPRERAVPAPYPLAHSAVPVGAIIIFPGEILQQTHQLTLAMTDLRYMPWMICDGTSLLISEYPDLYRVIGVLYGSKGSDSFNLPDYRGYFLRGVDLPKTLDQDERQPPPGPAVHSRSVGSIQKDALQDHQHMLQMGPMPVPTGAQGTQELETSTLKSNSDKIFKDTSVRISPTETRSINVAVNWLIKTQ